MATTATEVSVNGIGNLDVESDCLDISTGTKGAISG
jgi:hypothetical protein